MHYIIGSTKLVFSKRSVRPGASSSTKMNSKPPEFEYNKIYTLYNIKKLADEWCYIFKDQLGKTVEKRFESATQADHWIATQRGERLPDYSEFYIKNNS